MAKHALAGVEGCRGTRQFFMVDPKAIIIREGFNPRESFGGPEDVELKESIRENGFYQSRPLTVKKDAKNNVVLVDGERRLRSVLELIAEGVEIVGVPVIVENRTMPDHEQLVMALLSNSGKPLDPFEEGAAFKRLIGYGMTVDQIAKKVGKSYMFVHERMRLADATPQVKEAVRAGGIRIKDAVGAIREATGDSRKQNAAAERAAAMPRVKSLTVGWSKKSEGWKVSGPKETEEIKTEEVADRLKGFFSDDLAFWLTKRGFDPDTVKISIAPLSEAARAEVKQVVSECAHSYAIDCCNGSVYQN